MNKEEWEDYKNLSSQITEKLDNTSTYESWLIIQEYIDRCQQENKKYKEVIDKAIEFLYKIKFDKTDKYICISEYIEYQQLLDILKEVE